MATKVVPLYNSDPSHEKKGSNCLIALAGGDTKADYRVAVTQILAAFEAVRSKQCGAKLVYPGERHSPTYREGHCAIH